MIGLIYINNLVQYQYTKKSSINGGGSIFQKYIHTQTSYSLLLSEINYYQCY